MRGSAEHYTLVTICEEKTAQLKLMMAWNKNKGFHIIFELVVGRLRRNRRASSEKDYDVSWGITIAMISWWIC